MSKQDVIINDIIKNINSSNSFLWKIVGLSYRNRKKLRLPSDSVHHTYSCEDFTSGSYCFATGNEWKTLCV